MLYNIKSKIELLQEQITDLEQSGYYTEREMDDLSYPLRQELESFKRQLYRNQEEENKMVFCAIWKKTVALKNRLLNIEVIDAEILTTNNIQA